jgi:hypothetical protein
LIVDIPQLLKRKYNIRKITLRNILIVQLTDFFYSEKKGKEFLFIKEEKKLFVNLLMEPGIELL